MDAPRPLPASSLRRGLPILTLVLAALSLGADCFPQGSSDGGGGGYVGLGMPALEVTVDGTHVGPAPTTAGAYADLTTLRNEFGQLVSTDLIVHAQSGIASCDLHLSRFGTGVTAFRASPYRLETPIGATTADGTASLVGPITVTAGNLTLSCGNSSCGLVTITIMDSAHLEGYLSGVLADPSDGQASNVVCSFYLPWRTYQP